MTPATSLLCSITYDCSRISVPEMSRTTRPRAGNSATLDGFSRNSKGSIGGGVYFGGCALFYKPYSGGLGAAGARMTEPPDRARARSESHRLGDIVPLNSLRTVQRRSQSAAGPAHEDEPHARSVTAVPVATFSRHEQFSPCRQRRPVRSKRHSLMRCAGPVTSFRHHSNRSREASRRRFSNTRQSSVSG